MVLKHFMRKLQWKLSLLASRDVASDEEEAVQKIVPHDVKKGHFAVTAVKGGKPKRFILELNCLSDPEFVTLLEQTKEEFGVQQKGVLVVPCQPEELENILNLGRRRRASMEW